MGKTIHTEAVEDFFDAILACKDKEEMYAFFEDICTMNEVLSIAERLEVAKMLYRESRHTLKLQRKQVHPLLLSAVLTVLLVMEMVVMM